MLAKPKPMPKKRTSHAAFQRDVFRRDGDRCMNLCCRSRNGVIGHHIRFLSQEGEDTVENGILLCQDCHARVHGNRIAFMGDKQITGDEFMINILNQYICRSNFPTPETYKYIKDRVERGKLKSPPARKRRR